MGVYRLGGGGGQTMCGYVMFLPVPATIYRNWFVDDRKLMYPLTLTLTLSLPKGERE